MKISSSAKAPTAKMPSQTYFSLTPAWLHGSSCSKALVASGSLFCLFGITSSGARSVEHYAPMPAMLPLDNFCEFLWYLYISMLYHVVPLWPKVDLSWFVYSSKVYESNEKMCPVYATLGTSAPFCGPDNYVASHLQNWKVPSLHPVVERNGLESQWHNKQTSIHRRNEWLGR